MNRQLRAVAPWLAVAVGAVMLHQFLIPSEPEQRRNDWRREAYVDRPEVYQAANAFLDLRDSVMSLQRQLMIAESRERAHAYAARPMTGLNVTIDPGVSPLVAEHFRAAAYAELDSVANGTSVHPVHLIVATDSTFKTNRLRRAVVLPAEAGAPCTVVIRVAGQWQPRVRGGITRQVLGTCGFWARYGPAGDGMSAWLRESGMRTATDPPHGQKSERWNRTRISAREARDNPVISACRVSATRCMDLFNGEAAYAGYPLVAAGPSDVAVLYQMSSSSDLDTRLLAAMAESMGDARFGAIWRSSLPPSAAFEEQMGRPLTEWVHERVADEVEPYREGPSIPPVALAMTLMIATGAGLYGVFGTKRSMS